MIDSKILEKLQNSSVDERIRIIELILQSLKNDIKYGSQEKSLSRHNPLKGKVTHYHDPYQPVATEDWEANR